MLLSFGRDRELTYATLLRGCYLDVYRCFNQILFTDKKDHGKILTSELFSKLVKLHEITEKLKCEEAHLLKSLQSDDEGLTNYIKKFEEQFSRLMADLSIDFSPKELEQMMGKENFNYIESVMYNWKTCSKVGLLQKICAKKYFHNSQAHSTDQIKMRDSIIPISEEETYNDYDFDILFIPGQFSHPLRSWTLNDGSENTVFYKVWIKELLLNDLKKEFPGLKPRVLCMGYDSHTNRLDLNRLNLRDRMPEEICDELLVDMNAAKIGQKPVIVVSFSMGGILLKMMLKKD